MTCVLVTLSNTLSLAARPIRNAGNRKCLLGKGKYRKGHGNRMGLPRREKFSPMSCLSRIKEIQYIHFSNRQNRDFEPYKSFGKLRWYWCRKKNL